MAQEPFIVDLVVVDPDKTVTLSAAATVFRFGDGQAEVGINSLLAKMILEAFERKYGSPRLEVMASVGDGRPILRVSREEPTVAVPAPKSGSVNFTDAKA